MTRHDSLKTSIFPPLKKESNDRLKMEAHWDGGLVKAYNALGALKDGKVTDMATTVPVYTAKELPLQELKKSGPTIRLIDQREVEAFGTATRYRGVKAAWANEQESTSVKDAGAVLGKVGTMLDEAMKR